MLPFIRWQDIADIIIMTFLVYQLYSWFKNTKAMQVVIGLGSLGVVYLVTKNLGFFMTSWVLQELGTVLFVLIIVIFQSEIRQALYRFSLLRNFFGRQETPPKLDLVELSNAVFALAKERTGALIVFERKEPLDEYLLHGVPLDSRVSGPLIGTIFRDGTPLHDGAAVIREDRITQASCHLPLSPNAAIPQYYGTRHRAGLGLTERSDAISVMVSEERGEVSIAIGGELQGVGSAEELSERLHTLLAPVSPEVAATTFRRRFVGDLWPKALIFLFIIASWLIITGKQGGIFTVTAPIKFHNLPDGLSLLRTTPEEVELQLKFASSLTPSPKQLDITADIDLSRLREGVNTLPISNGDIKLPLGVLVSGINPQVVRVTADKKVRKPLRVRAAVEGEPPAGVRVKRIRVEPATVMVEGPQHLLSQMESLKTEGVDVSAIRQSVVMEKRLLQPAPQVKILGDETVRVRVITVGR